MNGLLLGLFCLGGVLYVYGAAGACQPPEPDTGPRAVPAPSTADELKGLYSQLLDASRTKDAAALRRILADDYWQTLEDGSVRSRAQRIDSTVAPDLTITSIELLAFRAVVHGDAAVATADVLQKGTFKGEPFESRVRSTVAFLRAGDQWRILTTHVSDLPAGTEPTAPQ
jgi:ketosteroid isomerase-like protein